MLVYSSYLWWFRMEHQSWGMCINHFPYAPAHPHKFYCERLLQVTWHTCSSPSTGAPLLWLLCPLKTPNCSSLYLAALSSRAVTGLLCDYNVNATVMNGFHSLQLCLDAVISTQLSPGTWADHITLYHLIAVGQLQLFRMKHIHDRSKHCCKSNHRYIKANKV